MGMPQHMETDCRTDPCALGMSHWAQFSARFHPRPSLYCGPVLRHPAVPIQAANFRSAVAF